jgi:uncharacterized membrane protein YqjE
VAAGSAILYLVGAIVALVIVKSLLKHEPFGESIAQVKKDRLWVQSLE